MTNYIAFTTFAFYPTMPPRLLPEEYGFLDTVRHDNATSVWMKGEVVNSLAAMPSMHFGKLVSHRIYHFSFSLMFRLLICHWYDFALSFWDLASILSSKRRRSKIVVLVVTLCFACNWIPSIGFDMHCCNSKSLFYGCADGDCCCTGGIHV